MQKITYSCDQCNIEKQESNHWFMYEIEGDEGDETIVFYKWREGMVAGHLCGLECASKKLNEVLSGGK